MRKRRGGLVYSTDQGRICPGCRRPEVQCACRDTSRARSGSGSVRISRETKGRKGAGVTVLHGLPLSDRDLARLASELKSSCGVGGAVKGATIELQGDQRTKVRALLEARGFNVAG